MGITSTIQNICNKLGNNNKAIYPMVAISVANGIFRPTFTMLKKGDNPESKKYAALREGITEVIAVPTYIISGTLAGKLGEFITSKATEKNIQKLENSGKILTDKAKTEMKEIAVKRGKSGLMLIGVCVAAGIIIPALCSVAVTPIMNKLNKKTTEKKLDIKENTENVQTIKSIPPVQTINRPVFKSVSYTSMKVGGV